MLPSQGASVSLRVMGHHCMEKRFCVYVVSIKDMFGARPLVQDIGVDNMNKSGMSPQGQGFDQNVPRCVMGPIMCMLQGAIQLLLGLEMCSLHSSDGCKAKNLKHYRTILLMG